MSNDTTNERARIISEMLASDPDATPEDRLGVLEDRVESLIDELGKPAQPADAEKDPPPLSGPYADGYNSARCGLPPTGQNRARSEDDRARWLEGYGDFKAAAGNAPGSEIERRLASLEKRIDLVAQASDSRDNVLEIRAKRAEREIEHRCSNLRARIDKDCQTIADRLRAGLDPMTSRLTSLEARIKEHDSYLYIAGKRTDKSITELWEDLSDVRSERERAHNLVSSRLDALEDRERTFEDRVRNLEFAITSAEKEVLELRQLIEAPEDASSPDPGDHPQQRIITDENGERRFRANPLVVYLRDNCPSFSLYMQGWSDADRRQFAQLIGYSVSAYLELDYSKPIKDDDGAES